MSIFVTSDQCIICTVNTLFFANSSLRKVYPLKNERIVVVLLSKKECYKNLHRICSTSVVQIAAISNSLLIVTRVTILHLRKESYIKSFRLRSRNSKLVWYLVPGRIVSAYYTLQLSRPRPREAGRAIHSIVGRIWPI